MVTIEKSLLETEEYWESLIKKSVSRYFLLSMLAQRPMHGYEIAKEIESCCDGWCKPTDGMIYPTIKEMVAGGYVECTTEVIGGRQRKVCHLTDKGKEAHRTAARVWSSVLPFMQSSVQEALSCAGDDNQAASNCGCGCSCGTDAATD